MHSNEIVFTTLQVSESEWAMNKIYKVSVCMETWNFLTSG